MYKKYYNCQQEQAGERRLAKDLIFVPQGAYNEIESNKKLVRKGMTYVISDIHGEANRYFQMLNLIRFSPSDELYIIGDVIDGGAGGIDVLTDIMDRPNVHLLLGNHEQMCLDTLGPHNQPGARRLWQSNGGSTTYRELVYRMDVHKRNKILQFLMRQPSFIDLDIGERQFHLVHAFPGKTVEDRIWERPRVDAANPFPDGRRVIVGHTPVCYFQVDADAYVRTLEQKGDHMRIFHAQGFICIDCGCGNKTPTRRLACLRMDDMKEFYS